MKNTSNVVVTKASGEKVVFDPSKLRHSLQKSGADNEVIEHILTEIQSLLYEGISTKEIYKIAFSFLRKSSRSTAARYKLKNAIYELGPSGFPFEKFIAEILRYEKFHTQVNVIIKGHCVNHEVDVIAEKEDKHFMVECKFHNSQGNYCDIKVPLYIHSRFLDVQRQWLKSQRHKNKYHQGWIFTNTRFTRDAIQYGNCAGLMLVGWNYPNKDSLKKRIDDSGLHPVTSLTSLTKVEKKKLLDIEVVLCLELCDHHDLLSSVGIPENRHKKILSEVQELCGKSG